ncbi:hypothetical protein [Mangrovitalea sediminis]|uniref:hypothetical protein n=1 Tax=Mangrovitalea sediminis TaxID=1982043 RepID=UPI000BE60E6C|nr:hypothetical protein [Mangrovitalea sediminis]
MLIHGEQIRLTPRERKVLFRLTGIDPRFIKTRAGLQRFVDQHLSTHKTDSPEIQLIKLLLQKYLPPGAIERGPKV